MPDDMEVNSVSTVIPEDTGPQASGKGADASDLTVSEEPEAEAVKPEPKPEKPANKESVRETLERASKDLKKEAEAAKLKEEKPAKAEEEVKEPVKAEKSEPDTETREAEKPAAGRDDKADARQSGGREHAEPPARFLPEASAKWANVPNEIKAEFHRVSKETEAELEQAQEAVKRYESIREYDELARRNGRDLRHTLERVVDIEQTLARNPLAGLDMILREIGPRKPDGSPMSLYEISQFVSQQSPQQLQQIMQRGAQQPQQQAQQDDPRIAQLTQQIQQMQTQMASSTVAPIVEQFAAQHPDFNALEMKIASVLKSGVIEQMYGSGLSPMQRLSEAYRMAGGQMAPSQPEQAEEPAAVERPVNPDAGKKSVRGAPNGGNDPEIDRPETNVRELLVKEMRKLRA